MPNRRDDVLDRAVELLRVHGLGALTMRRLGADLGVQPSAIYHHFPSKQVLLGAVADEVLARGAWPVDASGWPGRVRQVCRGIRAAMLGCTDGADVVATAWAFGLGGGAAAAALEDELRRAGSPPELVRVASRALLHYVFGHAFEEQTARQAVQVGAVARPLDSLADFDAGLDLLIDGLRGRLDAPQDT